MNIVELKPGQKFRFVDSDGKQYVFIGPSPCGRVVGWWVPSRASSGPYYAAEWHFINCCPEVETEELPF